MRKDSRQLESNRFHETKTQLLENIIYAGAGSCVNVCCKNGVAKETRAEFDGYTQLMRAGTLRKLSCVKALCAHSAEVEAICSEGRHVLFMVMACSSGEKSDVLPILGCLLQHGPNPYVGSKGQTPLHALIQAVSYNGLDNETAVEVAKLTIVTSLIEANIEYARPNRDKQVANRGSDALPHMQ